MSSVMLALRPSRRCRTVQDDKFAAGGLSKRKGRTLESGEEILE